MEKKSVMVTKKRCSDKSRDEEDEVTSVAWDFNTMTEAEEDLICRMYRLVGDRWNLIAGRIPSRKPEEIERFVIMRQWQGSMDINCSFRRPSISANKAFSMFNGSSS